MDRPKQQETSVKAEYPHREEQEAPVAKGVMAAVTSDSRMTYVIGNVTGDMSLATCAQTRICTPSRAAWMIQRQRDGGGKAGSSIPPLKNTHHQ